MDEHLTVEKPFWKLFFGRKNEIKLYYFVHLLIVLIKVLRSSDYNNKIDVYWYDHGHS